MPSREGKGKNKKDEEHRKGGVANAESSSQGMEFQ